jgi:hypothetical protein
LNDQGVVTYSAGNHTSLKDRAWVNYSAVYPRFLEARRPRRAPTRIRAWVFYSAEYPRFFEAKAPKAGVDTDQGVDIYSADVHTSLEDQGVGILLGGIPALL